MYCKTRWWVAVCLAIAMTSGPAMADLEAYYAFDEGAGIVAADLSGNRRDGTLEGDPAWVLGPFGSALEFDGTGDHVNIAGYQGVTAVGGVQQPFTVTNWFWITETTGNHEMVTWGNNVGTERLSWRVHEGRLRTEHGSGNLRGNTFCNDGEWHFGALVVNEGANLRVPNTLLYLDGVEDTTFSGSGNLYNLQASADVSIGRRADNSSRYWIGGIDDVAIFSHALSPEDILDIMENTGAPIRPTATRPNPSDNASDIPYYVKTLSWAAGDFATRRNVYYSTSFEDVNTAAAGALVAEGLTETTLEVPTTELGTTYYWRVDEVNGAPDFTVHPGSVWNFTSEAVADLITGVTVRANSQFNGTTGPVNVINGSGLTDGHHGTAETDMWLSAPGRLPATILFDFDQSYFLHEIIVWNQNQVIEPLLGFGAKDVTVEVSANGTDFTLVDGVGPLNHAPGLPGYAANSTIALNAVQARSVRMTITSGHGFIGQVGFSEVQFTSIPAFPRELSPINRDELNGLDQPLSWRAGRFAVEHRVLVGDRASVEDGSADTVNTTEKSLALADLEYGQIKYWQVIDVAADGTLYPSDIMSFFTPDSAAIDDMESYEDEENLEIWVTWMDGFDDPANGSVVGNGATGAPERGQVYEGRQSLPMAYDLASASFAEATQTFSPALDLTVGAPDSLGIYLLGDPNNDAASISLTVTDTGGKSHKVSHRGRAPTLSPAWTLLSVAIDDLSDVNVSSIRAITLGVERAGATGRIFADYLHVSSR